MKSPLRHWLVAVGAAAAIHAALAAMVLRQSAASSARSAGVGGIEVSFGPAGGASGAAAATEPEPEPEPPVEKEEPVEDVQTPPAPAEPLPEIAERPPVEEPQVPPPPDDIVPEPAAEPLPEPVAAPPPKPKPPAPEPPKKVAVPKPAPEKPPVPEPERQTARLPPSVAGVNGKAGTQDSRDAGSANDTSGGGDPGEVADYMAILQAWLEKHKEYPRRARLRRMEGTTLLYFVMDRAGRVLDFRIQKSSGYELLDHEVEEMIRRAQPLPEMPDSMRQARLELVVPVQFLLR